MDGVTEHVIARLKQRLRLDVTGEGYQSLHKAVVEEGVTIRNRQAASQRLVRWKRRWIVVVWEEQRGRIVTCWKASPRIVRRVREASV